MNILHIYEYLIERGRNRIKQKGDYLHKHRILPGYLGGLYTPDNITYLTPKEHKIVHLLRYKLYKHDSDIFAYIRLKGSFSGHKHKEITKKKISMSLSGEKNPFYGKKHSEESRKKIKEARAQQIITPESRQRRSEKMSGEGNFRFGKEVTSITREKISQANKGKKRTPEQCRHASTVRKGKQTGSNNPNSSPVTINGIEYNTKKEAATALNITYYELNKLLISYRYGQ